MLFNGMLHIMLWEGWVRHDYIAAHTSGFDALKATVRDCTPDLVAQICGIPKEDLFTGRETVRHLAGHAQPVLPGPEPVEPAARPRTRR